MNNPWNKKHTTTYNLILSEFNCNKLYSPLVLSDDLLNRFESLDITCSKFRFRCDNMHNKYCTLICSIKTTLCDVIDTFSKLLHFLSQFQNKYN